MTRDVIAEFSCSLNNNGTFKQYHVVSGSSFTDAYSETLDSAVILLSQVSNADRLINIQPYDFVRIYDVASWNGTIYTFDHTYLVDNYNEKEDRITDGRFFSYTINLMSMTKLLEKIQCPNLTITHNLDSMGGLVKKTIFQKICEYMDLFVPKIKMSYSDNGTIKWQYKPLIENPGIKETITGTIEEEKTTTFTAGTWANVSVAAPTLKDRKNLTVSATSDNESIEISTVTYNNSVVTVRLRSIFSGSQTYNLYVLYGYEGTNFIKRNNDYTAFYNKFNITSADLGSSCETLKQLLTVLMKQVGCIPTVRNLKLGFLDFNADAGDFALNGDATVGNTVNYVQKSLSSDSFVNTLVNMSSNVLDSGNEVVSETLGFRDRDSLRLKQKENLYLETKFPIFKVNSFKLNCMLENGVNEKTPDVVKDSEEEDWVAFEIEATKNANNSLKIKTSYYTNSESYLIYGCGFSLTYYITTYKKENGIFTVIERKNVTASHDSNTVLGNYTFDTEPLEHNFDYFLLEATGIIYFGPKPRIDAYVKNNAKITYFSPNSPLNGPMNVSVDITPIIKEGQEYSLLKTNYKDLEKASTIEELAQYQYGALRYDIGGKTISNFSNTYTKLELKLFGLSQVYTERTFIESIYEWLNDNYLKPRIREIIRENTGITILNDNAISTEQFNPDNTTYIKFTQFTFDIRYQPLNNFYLSFVKNKNDIDFPLEQFNSEASSYTDFDRLSLNQQESVDRIGNPTLFVSQRITPDQFALGYLRGGTDFKPTYYMRDGVKNTIFQRTYTVGNYKYDVNYTGSANAILKDYFTSIRTKYRAYEYVGLSNSTLRKEKDVIYVRIGENYFNGDDKVYFADGNKVYGFISGLFYISDKSFKYVCEKSKNKSNLDEVIKNDISLISNDNCFAIIYEQFDNVSAGPYVASSTYNTYFDSQKGENESDVKLAGVPQAWQEWNLNVYSDSHQIFYTSNLNYYDKNNNIIIYDDDDDAATQLAIAAKAPILPTEAQQIKAGSNVMYICDDNKHHEYGRTFYKDGSERLNHTVQFIYYPASDNIAWTENFISGNSFIRNTDLYPNAIYTTDMKLNKVSHTPDEQTETFISNDLDDYITLVAENAQTGEAAHILVTWNNKPSIKLCHYDVTTGQIADFIAFKRPDTNTTETKFYVTLNDTKSDYVMDVTPQGVLYRRYKVATNVNNRTVVNIYNEQ